MICLSKRKRLLNVKKQVLFIEEVLNVVVLGKVLFFVGLLEVQSYFEF